jgi:hypothetical protein
MMECAFSHAGFEGSQGMASVSCGEEDFRRSCGGLGRKGGGEEEERERERERETCGCSRDDCFKEGFVCVYVCVITTLHVFVDCE